MSQHIAVPSYWQAKIPRCPFCRQPVTAFHVSELEGELWHDVCLDAFVRMMSDAFSSEQKEAAAQQVERFYARHPSVARGQNFACSLHPEGSK